MRRPVATWCTAIVVNKVVGIRLRVMLMICATECMVVTVAQHRVGL
jgi:hypothetical protein